jgi:hypothetical protein
MYPADRHGARGVGPGYADPRPVIDAVVPARMELCRAAQQAAVPAIDVDGFVACLQERGYLVGFRRAPSGDLLG